MPPATRHKILRTALACFTSMYLYLPSLANAESVECNAIHMADSGHIGRQIVRYIIPTGSPCVLVQLIIPGGEGRYSFRKQLCSFDGKSLIDDFSTVEFKRGEFKYDRLKFEIALTPLGTNEVEIKTCEVNFREERPEELTCIMEYG